MNDGGAEHHRSSCTSSDVPAAERVTLVTLEAEVTTFVCLFLHFKMNLLTEAKAKERAAMNRGTLLYLSCTHLTSEMIRFVLKNGHGP